MVSFVGLKVVLLLLRFLRAYFVQYAATAHQWRFVYQNNVLKQWGANSSLFKAFWYIVNYSIVTIKPYGLDIVRFWIFSPMACSDNHSQVILCLIESGVVIVKNIIAHSMHNVKKKNTCERKKF